MTFRPTDDVLDSMENSQQKHNQGFDENISNDSGSKIFSNPDSDTNVGNIQGNVDATNSQLEEVKAPDLSELLDKNGGDENLSNTESNDNKIVNEESNTDFTVDLSEIEKDKGENSSTENNNVDEQENSVSADSGGSKQESMELETDKMSDEDREEIISGIQGAIHSKMDLLVDEEWKSVVDKYAKIYRILFRWGAFIFVAILGIVSGVMVQVKANQPNRLQLVTDEVIGNKSNWSESNIDKILSSQISKDYDIEPIVSYGSVNFNDKSFLSKSNLIKYQGIVLPQATYLDLESNNLISLDKFANKETTREDIENMLKDLITDSTIYKRTGGLANVQDSRRKGKTFKSGLIEGFGLECVRNKKVSDFVCDRLLERFYKYGQYYDLSRYSSEVLVLVKELKKQNKDIKPICTMIPEYVWHSGIISDDILGSVMNYCSEEDKSYYRKIKDFIDIDNSLRQPELVDRNFDNPDLNAYKLLSAQQVVYRLLSNSSINEGFIKSYLTFVQNLLNKDRGTGKYLDPIYKDILYVFNMDLHDTLIQKGQFSSKLIPQIDQINNGNLLLDYLPLTSQLTTPDIIKSVVFTGTSQSEITTEEIFSKYYGMTDRLQIRRATITSDTDTDVKVQTEIYSNNIFKVTGGETLKATIELRRKLNVLYVNNIRITNQPSFSDILNSYAAAGNASLDDMLGYIDEQVSFWYETEVIEAPSLCDKLGVNRGIELYTCDETSILLYKGDVEYAFTLLNGILDSFVVSDPDLEAALKERFDSIMTSRENTPTIIDAIIDFELEKPVDVNLEKKLEIINQFRIHFKLVPEEVYEIEGEDTIFMVKFSIGDFDLQGCYDLDTHLLTKVSYIECGKTLEIRNLFIEISTANEDKLAEILNNPRMFFANANPAAYRKYQRLCD